MPDSMDYNKITAEVIQYYVDRAAKGVVGTGDDIIKLFRSRLRSSYSRYLKAVVNRYSKTKTILYRERPVPLYSFYEHLYLECEKASISTTDIDSVLEINSKLIITGTAGSGKSTLLKHLFLNAIEKKRSIPVYVELRNLSVFEGPLIDFLYKSLSTFGFTFDQGLFHKSMETLGFLFFLDGFDEIPDDLRLSVTTELLELARRHDKNMFVVSSRPDDEFISWDDFTELRVQPLSKEQASSLVKKLNYDPVIKAKFVSELKKELYDQHSDFLSVPLLLTIMLMTYGQNAEIPKKMHLFYSQVFDTLFNKHDATKSVYKRKMFSDLAMDDFKSLLSAFCILSHSRHASVFSHDLAITTLTNASQITGIKVQPEMFLKDLLKSVCILNAGWTELCVYA